MNPMQNFPGNATLRSVALAVGGAMVLTLLPGCASIVGSERQTLPIDSTPDDAQILIIDESGKTVYRGRTPDDVTLAKSDGRYWGGKRYTVVLSKRGYLTERVLVDTHPNALYLGGNFIFGGLIGWLIVDPTSGKMYDLSEESIDLDLEEKDEASALPPPPPPAPMTAKPQPESAPPASTATAPLPSTAAVAPPPNPEPQAVPPAPAPAPAPAAVPAPDATVGRPEPTGKPPAEPPAGSTRPYWPLPPALPVSPSSSLRAISPVA